MKVFFYCFLSCLLFLSFSGCSYKNSQLEEVFKLAGENRHELERVIAHYGKAPIDSLKLKVVKEVQVVHIGSVGSYNNLGDTGDKAFDRDFSTFYHVIDTENSWTGLDFGESKKISTIHYSQRLLGIGIYQGNEYELFYWTDNGWALIDKKTATGQTIEFRAPKNGLFYLNNNSLKKRGKVFFTKKNKIYYYIQSNGN